MSKFWPAVLKIFAVVFVLFFLVRLLGLAAPYFSESLRNIWAERPTKRGESGLIYVESPEVYTRQRLVNDRYLQDAWLRDQLKVIDEKDTDWITTVIREVRQADTSIGSEKKAEKKTDGSDEASDGEDQKTDETESRDFSLSFNEKFKLQSNARDKIRQMILENALDDRHDLSGNTVFGLKFDTSVLPGSNTTLNPTVIVRMDSNPLDDLRDAHEHARFFSSNRLKDSRPYLTEELVEITSELADVREKLEANDLSSRSKKELEEEKSKLEQRKKVIEHTISLLQMNNEVFLAWKDDLEFRINQEISSAPCPDPASNVASAGDNGSLVTPDRDSKASDPLSADEPLCRNTEIQETNSQSDSIPTEKPAIAPSDRVNKARIDLAMAQASSVNNAIAFTLRVPKRDLIFEDALKQGVYNSAEGFCKNDPSDEYRLLKLFSKDDFSPKNLRRFTLPPALAPSFELAVSAQASGASKSCGVNLHVGLNAPRVPLFSVHSSNADLIDLVSAGLRKIKCEIEICEKEIEGIPGMQVWVKMAQSKILKDFTDIQTLDAIYSEFDGEVEDFKGSEICVEEFGDGSSGSSVAYDLLEGEELAEGSLAVCVPGIITNFDIGPYHFLRKMSEVESYIYATFPRGDVSGVVSETDERGSVSGKLEFPQVTAGIDLFELDQEKSAKAQPSLMNFASGDQHELFDFGWSIVKDGRKEPMIASQLVLVSVPAYLKELKLEILKGFLDVDKVPVDWAPWRENFAEYENERNEDERRRILGSRVEELFEGWETRTIELKIPPDYGALDNVLFGVNGLGGPLINTTRMQKFERTGSEVGGTEIQDSVGCHQFDEHSRLTLPIPGDRLWRSTVVTLNGLRADRIEVLPDMRGILAIFSPEERYSPTETSAGKENGAKPGSVPKPIPKKMRLTVWTSEGSDSADIKVCGAPGH